MQGQLGIVTNVKKHNNAVDRVRLRVAKGE